MQTNGHAAYDQARTLLGAGGQGHISRALATAVFSCPIRVVARITSPGIRCVAASSRFLGSFNLLRGFKEPRHCDYPRLIARWRTQVC